MIKQKKQVSFLAWRFNFILFILIFVVICLLLRVFDLAVVKQYFLQHQGNQRLLRLLHNPSLRGMILDRNGFPLAVSATAYAVWANPQEMLPLKNDLKRLAKLLQEDEKKLRLSLLRKKKFEFVYLKRGVSPEIAKQVSLLNINGVYLQKEFHRYYPEGEIAAHIIGFTNIDDQGQEGLEYVYNQWLEGSSGKKWVIKDRLGHVISDVETLREKKAGQNLTLSIDRRIQYLAYRALLDGVLKTQAEAGSVVVLDSKTGEVLAMVNQPSYNPNHRPIQINNNFRNRAVTDVFEPGSTLKAFTIAAALESGRYQYHSVVNTAPGKMRLDHNIVKDERNYGSLSLMEILQVSSNMGAAKIVLSLPANQLVDLLHRVGFGEITGIELPGEQSGWLQEPWGEFSLATLSFGYGISITALQLARAYAVIANDGIKNPISLLKRDHLPNGQRVLDEKVAKQMLTLLESVVKKGKGKTAQVPHYRVAGKTGTSLKVGAKGYQNQYTASFVGIAPLNDPRLVVAVILHKPKGKKHSGTFVSGPIFERVMEESLRLLDIPPDSSD